MRYIILLSLAGMSLCSSLWAYDQTTRLEDFKKTANQGWCGKFDHLGNYYWDKCQIAIPGGTQFSYDDTNIIMEDMRKNPPKQKAGK